MLNWSPILHFYQPPTQEPEITMQILESSYLPFLFELKKHPNLKLTVNIAGSLLLQLRQLNRNDFFDIIHDLYQNNQLEFINSPLYHPIIPLHRTEAIKRQLKYNTEIIERFLDCRTLPFLFPPELALDTISLETLCTDYTAIIADESAIDKNPSSANLPKTSIYRYKSSSLVISSRAVTDVIRSYPRYLDPVKFADWLTRLAVVNNSIVSVNDIEVFGHHYKERFDFLFKIHLDPRIKITPLSSLLKLTPTTQQDEISNINPSSWVLSSAVDANGQPFELWKSSRNNIQTQYWQLTDLADKYLCSIPKPDEDIHLQYSSAQRHFDTGISSCHTYWLSNWPWWNPAISQAGADQLISCIRSLPIKNSDKLESEKIYLELTKSIWDYHWSDRPQQMYDKYEQYLAKYTDRLPNLDSTTYE